jgi:hypothetical protein
VKVSGKGISTGGVAEVGKYNVRQAVELEWSKSEEWCKSSKNLRIRTGGGGGGMWRQN